MSKLSRVIQKIFGVDAGTDERSQIGSLAAGSVVFSTDPATLQALANYKQGLFGTVIGENSPVLEEINSLYFLITRQLSYLYQQGIAEWDAETEYFNGSLVRYNSNTDFPFLPGQIYECRYTPSDFLDPEPCVGQNPATAVSFWQPYQQYNDIYTQMTNMSAREWTPRAAAAANLWNNVIWDGTQFIAIGENASVTNKVMTSLDGITWTARTTPAGNQQWNSIAYGPSVHVAVAYGGTGNKVMTSSDGGVTWTLRASANDSIQWKFVIWCSQKSLFVACGASGTTGEIMTSPDGITWTTRTTPTGFTFNEVAYSSKLGLFVAVGSENVSTFDKPRIITSPDGITWTSRYSSNAITGKMNTVVWNPDYGQGVGAFVAMGAGTGFNGLNMVSEDGLTWSIGTPQLNAGWIYRACYSQEHKAIVAVVLGVTGYRLATCTTQDGSTWVVRKSDSNTFVGICYSQPLSLFVGVSIDGTNRVATSR